MVINENIGTCYTIRFETFRFQNPSFVRSQNNPFIFTLSGGCIGFSRLNIDDDFHLSFDHGFGVNNQHFVYTDLNTTWINQESAKNYDLSKIIDLCNAVMKMLFY